MAVTVAFFRTLLKKRTPRTFWYYLWLLALLRFLCPLGTQQSLSDRLMERPAELWVTVSEAEEGRPVPEKEGAITIAGEGDKSETKFWPYVLAALWGLGAITALQTAGYNNGEGTVTIPVFTVDGLQGIVDAINAGSATGAVGQSASGLASSVAALVANYQADGDLMSNTGDMIVDEAAAKIRVPYTTVS